MEDASAVRPGSARAWVLASRPRTLTAAVTPVLVGAACAQQGGTFRAGPAVAAVVGALLLQIGSNFANDLFDYVKGADNEERLGPTRATQSGLLTPKAVRAGMIVTFGFALAVGVYLAAVAGWPVVVLGLFAIASAILYTGGPYPLGYHGLGDLFVYLFFGFAAVCGTEYVQALSVSPLAWGAAVPVGALATAILVVNNVRDVETDRRAGKGTIPARFGRSAGRAEYLILVAVAFAAPVLLVAAGLAPAAALLSLLALPLAVKPARTVLTRTEGPVLNGALEGTAKLLFLHGLLFAAGIAAPGWVR